MRRPISDSRRKPSPLVAALVVGLTSLTALAQQAGHDAADSQRSRQNAPKTSRTDRAPAADAPRTPRSDTSTDTLNSIRKPQPETTRGPQTATPTQSRPSLVRPRPGAPAQPRPNTAVPPRPDLTRTRPDLSKPRPDSPTQPRPDVSTRIRQEIARPDQPRGPEPEPPADAPLPAMVRINTLAIIATNADNRIDPVLQDLANQLKPTFKFSGYRLAQSNASSVAPGQGASLQLVGAYSLQVTPTEADQDHVVLNVQAMQGNRRLLGLQLRLRPGMYQLLGGWPVSGGTLLAAVSAQAQ